MNYFRRRFSDIHSAIFQRNGFICRGSVSWKMQFPRHFLSKMIRIASHLISKNIIISLFSCIFIFESDFSPSLCFFFFEHLQSSENDGYIHQEKRNLSFGEALPGVVMSSIFPEYLTSSKLPLCAVDQ